MYIDERKTLYEKRMKNAQDNDKVIFYDYLSYKRACGWWTGLINDDWNRPCKIERAKYHATFLQNLPNYYFLGFPIKELLKSCYSGGYCHACAVALSLCFDNFEIIRCNLKNYADHYNQKSDGKINGFEHTFIVVDLEGIKTVIDTTWGMITDYETYKHIFNINQVRVISSEDLKNTKVYQYIKSLKEYTGAPLGFNKVYDKEKNEWFPTEEEIKHRNIMEEYMNMCKEYNDPNNKHLTDFINRCLFRTSNSQCLWNWRTSLEYKSIIDFQIQYPTTDLFSLTDDEFDFTLESPYKDTKERNARVLENYHKEKTPQKVAFKQRVLALVKKAF